MVLRVKWSTHRLLTLLVCREFLPSETCRRIANASIEPDLHPDYKVVCRGRGRRIRCYRIPVEHHGYEAVDMAFVYLRRAREKLKSNADFSKELGRAIHYIQDYAVNPRRRVLWIFEVKDEELHESLEREIAEIRVDRSTVRKVVEEAMRLKIYPSMFKGFVFERGQGRDARDALSKALLNTALAFKLVLKPDKPPDIERKYKKLLKIHVALLFAPWVLAAFAATPQALLLAALATLVLHYADIPFRKARIDYTW